MGKPLPAVTLAWGLLCLGQPPQTAAQDADACEFGPTVRLVRYGSVAAKRLAGSCQFTAPVVDSAEVICAGNRAAGPVASSYPATVIAPAGGDEPCDEYIPAYTAWCRAAVSTAPFATTTPSALAAATLEHTAVRLTWLDNGSYCRCETCPTTLAWGWFDVERRSGGGPYAVIAHLGPGRTEAVDRQVAVGQSYTYRVRAYDDFGPSPYSNQATVIVGAPATPRDVRATVTPSSQGEEVDLSWTAGSDDATAFEVERRTGHGLFVPLATTAAGETTYADRDLAADTTYGYRVRAVNPLGTSPDALSPRLVPSDGPSFPPGPPCCPTARVVQTNSGPYALLTWTDMSTNETGFRVERRSANPGSDWEVIAELPPSAIILADGPLAPFTAYSYRIVAYNAGGTSPSAAVDAR